MKRSHSLTGSRKPYRAPPSVGVSVAVAVAVIVGTTAALAAVSNPGVVVAFVAGAVTATAVRTVWQRLGSRDAVDRALNGLDAQFA